MLYRKRKLYLLFAAAVLTGLLAGIAMPELIRMGTGSYAGFFSLYSLNKFTQQKTDTWRLFLYLTAGRLRTLLFLWMSVYTAAGLMMHLGYLLWLGVSAGMLAALFLLRDGWQGICLFACCILPQWILYAQMWRQELAFMAARWSRGNTEDALSGRRRELRELAVTAGLCMLGCAMEAYLGLWTLRLFLDLAM